MGNLLIARPNAVLIITILHLRTQYYEAKIYPPVCLQRVHGECKRINNSPVEICKDARNNRALRRGTNFRGPTFPTY